MSHQTNCVFCQIAQHQAVSSLIYQDPIVTAFLDIQPINEGHVVVIPNDHASGLNDLPEETAAHMLVIARRLAIAIKHSAISCEGINLFMADGKAAMQEVFHAHLHIIPRFKGDGFGLKFPPQYKEKPQREQLDAIAEQLKQILCDE